MPIVGLEPSCILTFRDEYPDLLDDPRAAVLAKQSFLIDEFLMREIRSRARWSFASKIEATKRRRPKVICSPSPALRPRQFLLHGHCHQKALVGTAHALALLRMIPGSEAREVDSGCCGMAGSFGYEAEHYAISQAIGERALFPAVRALAPDDRGGGDGHKLPPADRRRHRAARAAPGRGAGGCAGCDDTIHGDSAKTIARYSWIQMQAHLIENHAKIIGYVTL